MCTLSDPNRHPHRTGVARLLNSFEYIDRRTFSGVSLAWASLSKLPLQVWGYWTPPNTCFLGTIRVRIPNGIAIESAVFAGLAFVDRQTDRQTALLGQ